VPVGANFTDSVIDAPAESLDGTANPLTLNPVACTDSAEIITGALPVFVTVKVIVLLEPTLTEPKLPGDGLNDSAPFSSSPCPCAAPGEKIAAINNKQMYAEYWQLRCRRSG
jgi:hypothetical protein